MSFDTSVITEVTHSVTGGQLILEWSTTAPAGTWFHVYVQGEKALATQALHASVEIPRDGVNRVDVGAVGATERDADFSSGLAPPANRADLTLTAPTGTDTAGFRIYGEASPGAGINYATPLATLAAEAGSGTRTYRWKSRPLTTGTWHYGARPFDVAGNEGTAMETSVAIAVPPRPPALGAGGKRLVYTYNQATKQITLNWLASPG